MAVVVLVLMVTTMGKESWVLLVVVMVVPGILV